MVAANLVEIVACGVVAPLPGQPAASCHARCADVERVTTLVHASLRVVSIRRRSWVAIGAGHRCAAGVQTPSLSRDLADVGQRRAAVRRGVRNDAVLTTPVSQPFTVTCEVYLSAGMQNGERRSRPARASLALRIRGARVDGDLRPPGRGSAKRDLEVPPANCSS
jgi:hypothetical protein